MPAPNMPTDGASNALQVLRPGNSQRIALTGASDAAVALDSATEVIRICSDSNIYYTANGTADNTKAFLAAGAYEYISVRNGDIPEFLDAAGAAGGFVILTEME